MGVISESGSRHHDVLVPRVVAGVLLVGGDGGGVVLVPWRVLLQLLSYTVLTVRSKILWPYSHQVLQKHWSRGVTLSWLLGIQFCGLIMIVVAFRYVCS